MSSYELDLYLLGVMIGMLIIAVLMQEWLFAFGAFLAVLQSVRVIVLHKMQGHLRAYFEEKSGHKLS